MSDFPADDYRTNAEIESKESRMPRVFRAIKACMPLSCVKWASSATAVTLFDSISSWPYWAWGSCAPIRFWRRLPHALTGVERSMDLSGDGTRRPLHSIEIEGWGRVPLRMVPRYRSIPWSNGLPSTPLA